MKSPPEFVRLDVASRGLLAHRRQPSRAWCPGAVSSGPAATGDRCCVGRVPGRIAPRARQASSCVRKEGKGRTKKGMSPISAARLPAAKGDGSQKLDLSPFSPPFPARFWHASSGGNGLPTRAAAAHTGGRRRWEVMACVAGPKTGHAGNVLLEPMDRVGRVRRRSVPWCELPSPPTPLPQTGEERLWRQVIASGSNVRDIPVKPAAVGLF